ncbi:uncharacterized protein LOC127150830 isoform X1 [Cucumis melo]|uniref:Uncharacterized protein LOC127150830 isoform X1 n=2 Tax=Cucumis melo TaxID=3656 RepID=A0ABM3L614_CUCME|nr:uncharacterized protein LOC127150830 isoform X1 [Cucumis melo]
MSSREKGMPLNFLGLGVGGGCGVGLGLRWGFGTTFGSKYRSSRMIFQGMEFDNKDQNQSYDIKDSKDSSRNSRLMHCWKSFLIFLKNLEAFWLTIQEFVIPWNHMCFNALMERLDPIVHGTDTSFRELSLNK